MRQSIEQTIFRQASTTYYWSARFFPKDVRDDVFRLYSFVRVADDFVDAQPQQRAKFKALRRAWEAAAHDIHFDAATADADALTQRVVKNMHHVYNKYGFDAAWVAAFLDAMQSDLDATRYDTLDDTLRYTYGSAEVIGLMMAKILNLSPDAYEAAMMQGRAMQYINFIRDIHEDYTLGRNYFPAEDLERFGLADLSPETAHAHKAAFQRFIAFQLDRYRGWQAIADSGFKHVPRRPRIALKTAVDMYNWTGRIIAHQPHIVFERKVKPARRQVLQTGIRRTFLG